MGDYLLRQTGPEVQEILNQAPVTREQLNAEVETRAADDQLLDAKILAEKTRAEGAEAALQEGKQDLLTFDNAPTEGSDNPVKSSGIYNAIKGILDLIPESASAENKLTDHASVSAEIAAKIAAATQEWKGQYDTLEDLEAVEAKTGDMGCVKSTDGDGHAVIAFYQYSAEGEWSEYYTLRHYGQNKPATTGDSGAYPFNGMGRIELPKNEVRYFTTWMFLPVHPSGDVYLLYSPDGETVYGIYNSATEKGLGFANNVVAEVSDYNTEEMDTITGGRYLSYTEAGGVFTITLPDSSTITSTQLNQMEIFRYEEGGNAKKNVLTQSMMMQANTIYVIQYDYEMGEDVTIPANCVLEFEGGSIVGGNGSFEINNFNSTKIEGNCVISNVKIKGLFNDITVYPNVQREASAFIISNGEVKDYITASSLYYANLHNCIINLNYNINTPSRYGAAGDLLTDDSEALQCVIDVMFVEEGEIELSSIYNNNAKGYLTTKPLIVRANNIPPGYPVRPRISRIKSDYCSSISNTDYSAYIKAINIPDKRGAIELIGYQNANECTTGLSYLCIDASDQSNSPYSFALVVGDAILNVFEKCKFIGRNAVLSYCGELGAGYSKICVKWDSCIFSPTEKYALSTGIMFGLGVQNGDNEYFTNCEFTGLVEIGHHGCYLENCMFHNDHNRVSMTMGQAGFIDSTSVFYDTPVDFSTGVAVFQATTGLKLTRCYFEDVICCIDVIGIKNTTGAYYSMLTVGKITVDNCFFNGLTNQYENETRIFADYGIRIREGFCDDTLSVLLINSSFRDGNIYEYPNRKYFFNYGSIVNESIALRVKVLGSHATSSGFNDVKEKYNFFGNIDLGNYVPRMKNEVTIGANTTGFFNFTSSRFIAFNNIQIIIKDISQSEFDNIVERGFNLFNTFNQLDSKNGDIINYGPDINAVLNLENSGYMTYDSVKQQAVFNLYEHLPLRPARATSSGGIISCCAEAGKEFKLFTYTATGHPLIGKTVEIELS